MNDRSVGPLSQIWLFQERQRHFHLQLNTYSCLSYEFWQEIGEGPGCDDGKLLQLGHQLVTSYDLVHRLYQQLCSLGTDAQEFKNVYRHFKTQILNDCLPQGGRDTG